MRRRCGGNKVYYQNEFDRQNNHTVQYAFIVPKRFFWGHFTQSPFLNISAQKPILVNTSDAKLITDDNILFKKPNN